MRQFNPSLRVDQVAEYWSSSHGILLAERKLDSLCEAARKTFDVWVEDLERFASLGLVPGTRFRVMRGGSPMAVAVGEMRLALGPDWADALVVVSQ